MHGFPQRAGALAVDDPHPQDAALPAFRQIIGDQLPDIRRLEGLQVQYSTLGFGIFLVKNGYFE